MTKSNIYIFYHYCKLLQILKFVKILSQKLILFLALAYKFYEKKTFIFFFLYVL